MNRSCKLSIYTPSSVVVKEVEASSILVPTKRGQINVLEDHTHLLTELEVGTLVTQLGQSKREFFINEGLCKILNDHVVVLAKSAESKERINLERAKESYQNALNGLAKSSLTEEEYNDFYAQMKRAEVRISIASH